MHASIAAMVLPSPERLEPVEILLVEDDPADVELTREGLRYGKLVNQLHVVRNGEEALAWLRRQGPYECAPRPDLILLDLQMPVMNGSEFLKTIKQDPELKSIPVVVLSTSDADRDIRSAYEQHANSFLTKPIGFEDFVRLVRDLGEYWFTLVQLPPNPSKLAAR